MGSSAQPEASRAFARLASLASTAAVLASVAAFLLLALGPHLLGYRTLTMLSGSMWPRYPTGAVLIDRSEPRSALRVGQVLTYAIPVLDHHVESHRIVALTRDRAGTVVVTKGDANNAPDPWHAQISAPSVWVVVGVVPLLGRVVTTLRTPWVRLVSVRILPALLVVGFLAALWRPGRPGPGRPRPAPRTGPSRRAPGDRRRLVWAVAALLVLAGIGQGSALAGFTSALTSGSATWSSATIAPVTALSATASCTTTLSTQVALSWTPSTSATVTGYTVQRSVAGGVYTAVGTVTPAGATGYTDTGLALDTTYSYEVISDAGSWTATSAAVSVTTPLVC